VGACAYTDATGAVCSTSWCEQHSRTVRDQRYCERHHEVIVALTAAAGTLSEFRPPLVTDRTLSLIQLLFRTLDPAVTALLEPHLAGSPDAVVSSDPHVRHQFIEGHVLWERGWGVAVPQGYLIRILLRIPFGEPPVLKLVINRREVLSAVPDWIEARLAGETPTPEDQAAFAAKLLDLITRSLSA
jgi:hypothetical protein